MSRAALRYAKPQPGTPVFIGFDAATPAAGYYRFRLVKDGPMVGIHIWHGPPHDPVTGEELDRSWRWQATANDVPIDLDRVWPACGRDPIDRAEHDYLVARARWAEVHAPAVADPRRPIDLLAAPMPI